MSQQHVETVRTIYAQITSGEDAGWELISPDCFADFSRRLIDPVTLRGRDETRAWFEREWRDMWDGGVRVELEQMIGAGDKVVACVLIMGRGKASGVDVEARVWNVWTVRDGVAIEWTYFGDDEAAARQAGGL